MYFNHQTLVHSFKERTYMTTMKSSSVIFENTTVAIVNGFFIDYDAI